MDENTTLGEIAEIVWLERIVHEWKARIQEIAPDDPVHEATWLCREQIIPIVHRLFTIGARMLEEHESADMHRAGYAVNLFAGMVMACMFQKKYPDDEELQEEERKFTKMFREI